MCTVTNRDIETKQKVSVMEGLLMISPSTVIFSETDTKQVVVISDQPVSVLLSPAILTVSHRVELLQAQSNIKPRQSDSAVNRQVCTLQISTAGWVM